MIVYCDNHECHHNVGSASGRRKRSLEEVELTKTWAGSEQDWRLLCIDTTDKTYRHISTEQMIRVIHETNETDRAT